MTNLTTITPSYQGFALFFITAFVVAGLLLVFRGRRQGWPMLSWLTIITWGAVFGFVGSKLMMIPYSAWLPGITGGNLPTTMEKTFLGGLLGGIVGIELARRWLGFRYPVADAYALVLPLGMAIGRVGCLLGGCCFGTPVRWPWAISYGPGSEALDAHTENGLLNPGATASLPVHPVQVYDIILMLGLAVVLGKVRYKFRRPGSLFLLYVALYGIIRFGEEFAREGGTSVWGLKLVQWGLLLAAVTAGVWLAMRERGYRARPALELASAGRWRIALAVAFVIAVVFAGRSWFTPLETAILGLHVVPLTIAAALALVPARRRGFIRQGALTLAAGGALLVSSDSGMTARNRYSYYNFDVGLTGGEYQEICGSSHRFVVGGMGLSRTTVLSQYSRLEYGARFYGGAEEVGESGYFWRAYPIAGVNPYILADSRWIGGGLGIHFGDVMLDYYPAHIAPQVSLRLGPRKILFMEARMKDLAPTGMQPMASIALGHEFKNGSSLRLGLGFLTGAFIEPNIVANDGRLELSPYLGLGGSHDYQFGMALRWRFGRE